MSLVDQYEVLELIGRGSFGQIRKVRRKHDGHILVRKEIAYHRMSEKEKQQLTAECGILAQVKHPNIVQYFARDHVKSDATLHLYMEYCGNGDLSKTIRECRSSGKLLPESMIWTYFTQILLALYRCHNGINPPEVGNVWAATSHARMSASDKRAVKILHRDLKPENIFLGEEGDVKLGDFGLSKMLAPEQQLANTYVGTPYYMSPEIVSDMSYTHKSDIWSLGCIIYELCQLSPPFNAKTQWSLIDKIKQGSYAPIPKQYSHELRHVIDMCLQVNPIKRPDTATLLDMDIFRIMRKERELVLFHRELKSIEGQMKMKEEALRQKERELVLKERQLLAQAEKMQEDYDNRVELLDGQLRAEWEVLALQEIQRQVEMKLEVEVAARLEAEVAARLEAEVAARLEAEVAARLEAEVTARLQAMISELDLVPRSMRGGQSPPGHSSLGSSGESSGISSRCDSPPHSHYQRMIPDSPADITMASPSVWGTPGIRNRDYADETPKFGHFGQMLPPFSDHRPQPGLMGPPETPRRTAFAGDRTITEITNETAELDCNEETARKTMKRPGSTYLSGSPTRMAPPSRRGLGFQRSGTTGDLGTPETQAAYGMGGRGNSKDDVATVRKATDGGSMSRARSIVEIQRMQRIVGPAPKWDPNSDEAPSPYLKRNTMRYR